MQRILYILQEIADRFFTDPANVNTWIWKAHLSANQQDPGSVHEMSSPFYFLLQIVKSTKVSPNPNFISAKFETYSFC